MNEHLPFPPEAEDLPVSDSFQDQVLDRVHRHVRIQRAVHTGMTACLVALAAFFLGQQLTSLRSRERDARTPRVASAERGVHWLLETQEPAGNWNASTHGGNDQFTLGITSLATLALMNSPDPVPRESLNQALTFLEKGLQHPSLFTREGPEFYNAMFALLTLQEATTRYPDPERDALVHSLLSQLIRKQHPQGGWGYLAASPFGYRDITPPNSAVTWWMVQVLDRSGPLPGKSEALARASSWLQQRFDTPSSPEYRSGDPVADAAGKALFWMGLEVTHLSPPEEFLPQLPDAYRDFVRSQVQQPDAFLKDLQKFQQQDGSWDLPEDRWWKAGGQVYVTALRVLAQVPRRG